MLTSNRYLSQRIIARHSWLVSMHSSFTQYLKVHVSVCRQLGSALQCWQPDVVRNHHEALLAQTATTVRLHTYLRLHMSCM